MTTVTVSTRRLEEAFISLRETLSGRGEGSDLQQIIKDEGRLLLKQVIKFTPPDNKAQGARRIEKDLKRIFTPVAPELIRYVDSRAGLANINIWLESKATKRPINYKWDRIDPTGAGMRDFHRKNRNSRGRTRSAGNSFSPSLWKSAYVVPRNIFERYLKQEQAKSGRLKAGWGPAYERLGGKLQAWVARHKAGAQGSYVDNLSNPTRPSFTLINSGIGAKHLTNILQNAVRARGEAIHRRVKLILSGYSKQIKAGITKIRREANTGKGDA